MTVLECAPDGPPVRTERDATDLVGEAFSLGAELVVLPFERLDDDFFDLSTGVAGAVVQKFVTYRLRLAIIGDISRHLDASSALRAYVAESNRGAAVWFAPDLPALTTRLARLRPNG